MEVLLRTGPRAVITASGTTLYELSLDELTVLTGYCLIREQAGSLVVEFDRNRAPIRWDVKPNLGNPKTLAEMIAATRRNRGK